MNIEFLDLYLYSLLKLIEKENFKYVLTKKVLIYFHFYHLLIDYLLKNYNYAKTFIQYLELKSIFFNLYQIK